MKFQKQCSSGDVVIDNDGNVVDVMDDANSKFFNLIVSRLVESGLAYEEVRDNKTTLLPLIKADAHGNSGPFVLHENIVIGIENYPAFAESVYSRALEILESKSKVRS